MNSQIKDEIIPKQYTTLVISGGAIKGILSLGALHYIYKKEFEKTITTFIGTSIGAIISYFLILGYTPLDLITYVCTHPIFEDITELNIHKLINGNGAMSFTKIQDVLEKMTLEKEGQFHTLKSLYEKFKKKLVCCTYNTSFEREECISYENYPDMPCLIALKLSASLPIVFEECRYMNMTFIDGGIVNNFPIECVKSDEHALCIITPFVKNEKGYKNILDHIYDLVFIPINKLLDNKLKTIPENCDLIVLISEQIKFFTFNIGVKGMLDMFSTGYNCALTHFSK